MHKDSVDAPFVATVGQFNTRVSTRDHDLHDIRQELPLFVDVVLVDVSMTGVLVFAAPE